MRLDFALNYLGSLRLTLWLLPLFALAAMAWHFIEGQRGWLIVVPLSLLAFNLLAAITVNPAFRRQPALLTFHLALLTLVLLAAVGRLTHFTGQAEVTVSENFDSATVIRRGGPWHEERLDQVHFTLERFTIDYTPRQGMAMRDVTRAHVRWRDDSGLEREGVVGDHRPLVLGGYRFYTTHNKGFAPVFIWQPEDGAPRQGSIHLPAWPANEFNQALDWTIPGSGHRLWTQLQFDEVILDPERPSQFRAPGKHLMVVRTGERRYELYPGQSLDLAGGRLTYKELRTWMGFTVFYDWTLPWLFAAGLIAVLSLGWHYWRKFATRPWLDE